MSTPTTISENANVICQYINYNLNNIQKLYEQIDEIRDEQLKQLSEIMNLYAEHQEALSQFNIPFMLDKLSHYTQKARKLAQDMRYLTERGYSLKERSRRVARDSARLYAQQEQEMKRQLEREQLLIAKPAWQNSD